jgi:hypothetical protein
MATYTERLAKWPLPIGLIRPMTFVPSAAKPTTRNIISRRSKQHDSKSPSQIACRSAWKFAGYQWARFSALEKSYWEELVGRNFFSDTLLRWLSLYAPCKQPDGSTDPSAITISILWGIAILRSPTEIVTPDPYQAVIFLPTTTITPIIFVDSPLTPGTYHYRAAAFETTGKLGPFSSDVFSTIP